jgi:hypothetical protein
MNNINLSGEPGELYRVPGAPDPNVIAKVNKQAQEAFVNAGGTYSVVEGANQASNEFPYRAFVNDSYDNIAQLKYQVSRGNYKVPFEKVDAEYLFRKRAQIENADYDRWVMQKYDLSNPAQNMLLQQLDPDQFKRRMDLLKKQIALESRYAEVRMLGAKSEEDLKFEWLVESGRIQMPEGPLWDPKRWMENQLVEYEPPNKDKNWTKRGVDKNTAISKANRKRMIKGLFEPLDYPNQGQTGWQANRNNYSDLRGMPDNYFQHQLFAGSDARSTYKRFGLNPIVNETVDIDQSDVTPGLVFGGGYQKQGDGYYPPPGRALLADRTAKEAKYISSNKATGYGSNRKNI